MSLAFGNVGMETSPYPSLATHCFVAKGGSKDQKPARIVSCRTSFTCSRASRTGSP